MINYATIYTPSPSLLGSKLFNLFSEITNYNELTKNGNATGFELYTVPSKIIVNFMDSKEQEEHIKGFCGFAIKSIDDKSQHSYILSRIYDTKLILGFVIENGFDEDNVILNLILDICNRLNGLLFVHDSIIDYDGEPICGPMVEVISYEQPPRIQ